MVTQVRYIARLCAHWSSYFNTVLSLVSSERGETEERRDVRTRKQSTVTPEFQMSMLRASLEESKMISSLPQVER